jgi:hypothetical protein
VESALGVVDSLATNILGYARSIEEKIDYPKDKRIPVGIITGFLGSGTFLQRRRTSPPIKWVQTRLTVVRAAQARQRSSTTY